MKLKYMKTSVKSTTYGFFTFNDDELDVLCFTAAASSFVVIFILLAIF
jgi:hypothetical protein